MTTIHFEKRCPRCNTVRPLGAFYRNRAKPDGHSDYCRPCERQHRRDYLATPAGRAASREATRRHRIKAKAQFDAAAAVLSAADRARLDLPA